MKMLIIGVFIGAGVVIVFGSIKLFKWIKKIYKR